MRLPDDVRSAFEAAPVCYLATCGHGVPNVVPVGFFWVVGDWLLLADLFFDKTRRNLATNPAVAVTVAAVASRSGFQLKGRATVHHDGECYDRLHTLLSAQGVPTRPHAAILINVTAAYVLDPGPLAGARLQSGPGLELEDPARERKRFVNS